MQFHVKRLRAFYLNWIRALYKFRYNNNKKKCHCRRDDVAGIVTVQMCVKTTTIIQNGCVR